MQLNFDFGIRFSENLDFDWSVPETLLIYIWHRATNIK